MHLLSLASGAVLRLRKLVAQRRSARRFRTKLHRAKWQHRRAIAESAARYRAIVETAVDAIMVADGLGTIRSFNRAAESIFGYSQDEVVGKNLRLLMQEPDRTAHDGYLEAYRRTGERRIIGIGREVTGLHKDGSKLELELSIAEWCDLDGEPCFTGIMRDVTQRNQQARDLQRALASGKQARLDAEAANQAKTNFLAVMSHEIRTPLTSIDGFADLLWRTKRLTQQQRRYVELIRAANAALLTIVNDILDFSKVEAGQIELQNQPFSPSALIHDVMGIVQPVAAKKDLLLRWSVDPKTPDWLLGDVVRLQQILLNLLNNAVKFTDSGSISVTLKPVQSGEGNEVMQFSVADTGNGIPAHHQERLFKQFSQADGSISRRYGGTGLGLAICKNLVELMGGTIGIVSEVGQGATLWFAVPLAAAPMPSPKPQMAGALDVLSNPKGRILLVDDIETNLEIVQSYLSDGGYDVVPVDGGAEAVRRLQEETFDIVLMDVQMPVMDGVMTTHAIRGLPGPQRDIPIIAMTGNVLPQQVESFIKAGMNDHVGKPIERAKLYSKLWRWIPRHAVRIEDAAPSFSDFNRSKLDELIGSLGVARTERTVRKFRKALVTAFSDDISQARYEAHDLINSAGVLGFDRLVEDLRALKDCEDDAAGEFLAECRQRRDAVLKLIDGLVLPLFSGQVLRKIAS